MKIGIIGYGNMGSAIGERVKAGYSVIAFDRDQKKTKGLRGIKVASDMEDLVKNSDIIVLAVKPQDFDAVLNELKEFHTADKLILSIAAGISTLFIEKRLGASRVIRAMPNLAAMVGKATSCMCKGRYASATDLISAKRILGSIGKVKVIDEKMMDAATAVSGSGPGFWAFKVADKPEKEWLSYSAEFFVPEFSSAAESVGFGKREARFLASSTTSGTIAIVDKWHISPQELKDRVASKGGTTEAGLKELEKSHGTLKKAVKAALARAKKLEEFLNGTDRHYRRKRAL